MEITLDIYEAKNYKRETAAIKASEKVRGKGQGKIADGHFGYVALAREYLDVRTLKVVKAYVKK